MQYVQKIRLYEKGLLCTTLGVSVEFYCHCFLLTQPPINIFEIEPKFLYIYYVQFVLGV